MVGAQSVADGGDGCAVVETATVLSLGHGCIPMNRSPRASRPCPFGVKQTAATNKRTLRTMAAWLYATSSSCFGCSFWGQPRARRGFSASTATDKGYFASAISHRGPLRRTASCGHDREGEFRKQSVGAPWARVPVHSPFISYAMLCPLVRVDHRRALIAPIAQLFVRRQPCPPELVSSLVAS
jgi:hypothetical protein